MMLLSKPDNRRFRLEFYVKATDGDMNYRWARIQNMAGRCCRAAGVMLGPRSSTALPIWDTDEHGFKLGRAVGMILAAGKKFPGDG